jgi:hypothetical protein
MSGPAHRIRLRLPNGSELEAEGSPEFVAGERREFLSLQRPPQGAASGPGSLPEAVAPAWDTLVENRSGNLQLRAKLHGDKTEKDACLVLLAAADVLLRTAKPTAAQLARWLRVSGYPVSRVDRALREAVEHGEILASGSRRARRYELSGPGRVKAILLAHQLAGLIGASAGS